MAPAGCSLSRSSGSDLVLQHEGRIGAAAAAVLNVYYRPGPRDEAIQTGRVRARLVGRNVQNRYHTYRGTLDHRPPVRAPCTQTAGNRGWGLREDEKIG